MNLWIRSQDRIKLVNVHEIAISDFNIIGYFDKETEYEILGTYKAKERVLEVLDEIQKQLNGMGLENTLKQIYNMPLGVFEMPKE